MRSLKLRLLGLWVLSLLSSLVLGVLLAGLYRQSADAQLGRSRAVLAHACDLVRDRFGFYAAGWTGPVVLDTALRQDLHAVLAVALARQTDVAGGIWSPEAGSLAFTGLAAELDTEPVAAINAAALREDRTLGRTVAGPTRTLLLAACPLDGPISGATAWTMLQVQATPGLRSLQGGLITLGGLLLLSTILLGRTVLVWGRHVRGIEAVLARAGEAGLPAVARSGERDLDRIVDALNRAGERLRDARRKAEDLANRVARAERLAALGRVAAGMAHEIRNPIAAARLQGENALAGDDARRRQGIGDMLGQLHRLDGLVSELLAMTQRTAPVPEQMDLPAFLADRAAAHKEAAAAAGIRIALQSPPIAVRLDPAVVARILDNLLTNAIRHAAPAGTVSLEARCEHGRLVMTVADDGAGLPAGMAAQVFEPFVTGRADGTGLGLAIARELTEAHGGRLVLQDSLPTTFVLDLPQEEPCPPS